MRLQNKETKVIVRVYPDVTEAKVTAPNQPVPAEGGKRAEIRGMSDKSRHRMIKALCQIQDIDTALFLTLTYPDHFPLDKEQWKSDWGALRKRLRRKWPEIGGIWRLEFQVRKSGDNAGLEAPHFHLLVRGVQAGMGEGHLPFVERSVYRDFLSDPHFVAAAEAYEAELKERSKQPFRLAWRTTWIDAFRIWLSLAWAEIVARRGHEDRKHRFAGTQCSYVVNRRHATWYITKYMSKDPAETDQETGRMWGRFGQVDRTPLRVVTLTVRQWLIFRQLAIGWLQAAGSKYAEQVAERGQWVGFSIFGLGESSKFAEATIRHLPGIEDLLQAACSGTLDPERGVGVWEQFSASRRPARRRVVVVS